VSGSLTRRQLLIRTGGASVALACFGALPMGAIADAVLDAIDPAFRTLSPDAAHAELASWGARTQPDALALVALEFEPSADTHTIVFTV